MNGLFRTDCGSYETDEIQMTPVRLELLCIQMLPIYNESPWFIVYLTYGSPTINQDFILFTVNA